MSEWERARQELLSGHTDDIVRCLVLRSRLGDCIPTWNAIVVLPESWKPTCVNASATIGGMPVAWADVTEPYVALPISDQAS